MGLFVAWEVDGEIPDKDAPPSAANTKNAIAQASLEKLVQDRLTANLLARNPNATEAEVARTKRATMNRSLRRHYDVVVQFTALWGTFTLLSVMGSDGLSSHTIFPSRNAHGATVSEMGPLLWVVGVCV